MDPEEDATGESHPNAVNADDDAAGGSHSVAGITDAHTTGESHSDADAWSSWSCNTKVLYSGTFRISKNTAFAQSAVTVGLKIGFVGCVDHCSVS